MPKPRRSAIAIKVLLADDHRLLLNGVRNALETSGGFRIVGEAMTTSEVMPLVRRGRPDVVMLDLRLAGSDARPCLDQIKRHHAHVTCIVLSASADRQVIDDALRRGARAYVVKSVKPVDLPAVIRQAMAGTVSTPFGLHAFSNAKAVAMAGLTERELTVLTAAAEGFSNTDIARQLWIAPQTVKYHLGNIYRKLGVANRIDASRRAYQRGLIESPGFPEGSKR
jgi:DNA-binding NarL/FixJ family response regulator